MAISLTYSTANVATINPLASKYPTMQSNVIIWAIVCSFLLHALLAITLPNVNFNTAKEKPIELKIEILQPVQPIATPAPEPVKPAIITPKQKEIPKKVLATKPKTQPKLQVKPKLLPKVLPELVPNQDIAPTTQEPVQLEPLPSVIAVAPQPDVNPIVVAPPALPEPPTQPTEQDLSAALSQYGSTLFRAFAKYKQYPKIAQMRGWQGQCMLEIKIDSVGNVLSTRVKESSGYESLDNQALEMSKKATPFPAPPNALQGRSFTITVPISFKLE